MNFSFRKLLVFLSFIATGFPSLAQTVTNLGTYLTPQEAKRLYTDSVVRHTSFRPYVLNDNDSLFLNKDSSSHITWGGRKLFDEHLLQVVKPEYKLYLDFLPDFQVGSDLKNDRTTWVNTRGFLIGGNIGKSFSFYTSFYENQGVFPLYVDNYTRSVGVLPGQGEVRNYGDHGFDYSSSQGHISYTPSKYLNFDLGYDKNFIGDGYRSLLLSDVAAPYPYVKLTASVWKLRYMMMWSQMIDRESPRLDYQNGYRKKWGAFHYLDWNISKKVSVGLFENIIWMDADSLGKRGFDWSYLNPLLFFRPVEFANGSPDKALVGLTAKYKMLNKFTWYGQFALNEFTAKEFFSGDGYWANKWGTQIGFRSFDIFGIPNLHFQGEANIVRPYTYTARIPVVEGVAVSNNGKPTNNYTHFSQPLAHLWGANFEEFLGIVNYTYKRLDIRGQFSYGYYGLDPEGLNYGKNILKPYDTRVSDYGNYIGQGITTSLYYGDIKIAYVLNPKYNLRFETGLTYRNEKNDVSPSKTTILSIGLRSSFRNLYYDF
ncbi:hypothetical protein NF867_09655 [Solitalea sp. MAHUQ-68]|uniref:Gliding motility protein RemB n=1 Tax=Solitalea agri TaxID=2953739 RepID=A0A9X2F9Y1_9SPHI|nr:hypothetical protein [Solitalea agri]MCO4293128.1 hypothetical protein [Solitalea agri]